jgi:hypothetical protein
MVVLVAPSALLLWMQISDGMFVSDSSVNPSRVFVPSLIRFQFTLNASREYRNPLRSSARGGIPNHIQRSWLGINSVVIPDDDRSFLSKLHFFVVNDHFPLDKIIRLL